MEVLACLWPGLFCKIGLLFSYTRMAILKENMTFGECFTLGHPSHKEKFTRLPYKQAHESPQKFVRRNVPCTGIPTLCFFKRQIMLLKNAELCSNYAYSFGNLCLKYAVFLQHYAFIMLK